MLPEILQLDAIRSQIVVPSLIQAIEQGFVLYSEKKVVVPPVGFLHFEQPPGDVHIKYGYIKGDDVYVLKVASGFSDNTGLGVPVTDGVILVFSQQTGQLKLVLHDECWLTDMRTAAAGAVAAKHLAPRTVRQIGIVGTGTQARMQLELLQGVIDCQRCLIWGRDPDKANDMLEDLASDDGIREWGLKLRVAGSIDELASECNLIVTTTSARQPVLLADNIRPGTHITAIGSDDHGKQELEAAILGRADVVVADSVSQCVDHGECHHAVKEGLIDETSIVELGNVIANSRLGRTSDDQVTIADLTGIAVQDIQIAKMVSVR